MTRLVIDTAPMFNSFYYIRMRQEVTSNRQSKLSAIEDAGYTIHRDVIDYTNVWWVEIEDDADAALFKLKYL